MTRPTASVTPKTLYDINEARKIVGLPPLKVRTMKCARCDKEFKDYSKRMLCADCAYEIRDCYDTEVAR
jgi:formylmethanofuran dehydrogenase subunit E